MYPCLRVNLTHLAENVRTVSALCKKYNIHLAGITKVFHGDPVIAKVLLDNGISMLGDSRITNLKRLASLYPPPAETWLIRPPMLSEVEELVQYATVSLQSELATIRAVDEAARRQGKVHKVILMADLGDIREGYTDYEELLQAAMQVEQMDHVHLYGIGTNLTCFSFVQPTSEKMDLLVELAEKVEMEIGRNLDVISGGNSATVQLMLQGGINKRVNNLRLGESVLFGKERAGFTFLPSTYHDVFTIDCEIIELKEKPSLPWGLIGKDSYGNTPSFVDRGPRKKAICALGKQDFDIETTTPVDPGIILLGASSDHLMLDVTDSKFNYQVGACVQLQLGYFSTLRAFTAFAAKPASAYIKSANACDFYVATSG